MRDMMNHLRVFRSRFYNSLLQLHNLTQETAFSQSISLLKRKLFITCSWRSLLVEDIKERERDASYDEAEEVSLTVTQSHTGTCR